MKRMLLTAALLSAASLLVAAGTAAASLPIQIINPSSTGAITASSPPTIQFTIPSMGSVTCLVQLSGTIPSRSFPIAPLAPATPPILPIGQITAASVICPTGQITIQPLVDPPHGPWQLSLDNVLLTPLGGAIGMRMTILDVKFRATAPGGPSCLFSGNLPVLYDRTTSLLSILTPNSLPLAVASSSGCAVGLAMSLAGQLAVTPNVIVM